MATLVYNNAGKIRDKKLTAQLEKLLTDAADAAKIDTVSVTSGGQDRKGTPNARRTGSTRHDDGQAADIQLLDDGDVLDFDVQLKHFEDFVVAAAGLGATGLGAGAAYMGTKTIHVGFGSKLVWGAEGKAVNAPKWLKAAANKGWGQPIAAAPAAKALVGMNVVIARDGLRLRGGPGPTFEHISTLEFGTELTVTSFQGAGGEWALVDLEGDGQLDGFVFAAFLTPSQTDGA
ncbi:MAG: SH3 domain-containing protein [Candidatus Accumulibacter sp. UW20]